MPVAICVFPRVFVYGLFFFLFFEIILLHVELLSLGILLGNA